MRKVSAAPVALSNGSALEIIPCGSIVDSSEPSGSNQQSPGLAAVDAADLGRPSPPRRLLAVELDPPRDAHRISLLPSLARLHPCRRCPGFRPRRQFSLDPLSPGLRAAFSRFGARVVDL